MASKAQGRSMSAEAVTILRAALQGVQPEAGRSQAIDRLRTIRQRAHLGADARPAAATGMPVHLLGH